MGIKGKNTDVNINQAITQLVKSYLKKEEYYCKKGFVTNVDKDEMTADFQSDDGDIETPVRIGMIDSQIQVIPENDTLVLVAFETNTQPYVVVAQKASEIIWNNGSNEGLINIVDITEKLNDLVEKVNNLYTLLQTWTVVAQDGGLALQVAANLLSEADDFDKDDYEDVKIKH